MWAWEKGRPEKRGRVSAGGGALLDCTKPSTASNWGTKVDQLYVIWSETSLIWTKWHNSKTICSTHIDSSIVQDWAFRHLVYVSWPHVYRWNHLRSAGNLDWWKYLCLHDIYVLDESALGFSTLYLYYIAYKCKKVIDQSIKYDDQEQKFKIRNSVRIQTFSRQ